MSHVEAETATPASASLPTQASPKKERKYASVLDVSHERKDESSPLHTAVDNATGLSGPESSVVSLVGFLDRVICETLIAVASALKSKGTVAISRLDDLRDSVQLELVDCGVSVRDRQRWVDCVKDKVIENVRKFIGNGAVWTPPFIASIIASENGKDARVTQARRVLSEDKRSPFCKQSAVKQDDGSYKFSWRVEEEVSFNGLLIHESKIEFFEVRMADAVTSLMEPLDSNREVQPKPFGILEQFSEDVEISRIEAGAMIDDTESLGQYISILLEARKLDVWHASTIAAFCASQYTDTDSKERTRLKDTLLSDRQSDFAEDPYYGWRPVIPDAKLERNRLPRTSYEAMGFSLQAEISGEQILEVLSRVLCGHLSRWKNQKARIAWSLVEGLVRDARTEGIRTLLHVEEPALMAITLEGKFASASPSPAINATLAEFVVEMLQVRPTMKVASDLKRRLLSHSEIFTDKELLVPRPLAVDIGVDDSFEELVRSILDHKLAEYAKEPTDSQDLARALAEALVQHGVKLKDSAAFTRFVLPEVALFAKTKMQGVPFDSENFVHVLVEMISALAEDESLKI